MGWVRRARLVSAGHPHSPVETFPAHSGISFHWGTAIITGDPAPGAILALEPSTDIAVEESRPPVDSGDGPPG